MAFATLCNLLSRKVPLPLGKMIGTETQMLRDCLQELAGFSLSTGFLWDNRLQVRYGILSEPRALWPGTVSMGPDLTRW